MEENLEYRMYGLVPYNISPIQQAIQFGHAVVEYGQNVKGTTMDEKIYDNWANNHKTFIILNGGTTNDCHMNNYEELEKLGSLNQHRATLIQNKVLVAEFREPDLNDALTAVVFLVDERVFNKKKYPDFNEFYEGNEYMFHNEGIAYDKWIQSLGGDRNVFLRDFLSTKRLA